MTHNSKIISGLISAISIAVCALPAMALRKTPGVVEPGDTGMFSVPFSNQEGGVSIIRNARLEVTSVPYWVSLDTGISFMGPVDIYPGEDMVFNVFYSINDKLPKDKAEADIGLSVFTDSPQFVPSSITWRFKTDNAFFTMRGECVDNSGASCGEYVSPDKLAPVTTLSCDSDFTEGPDGAMYVGAGTVVKLQSHDAYAANSNITRVKETRYSLDEPADDFNALKKTGDSLRIDSGSRTLYFASVDNAGNKEPVQKKVIAVGKPPSWLSRVKSYWQDKWHSVTDKAVASAAPAPAAPRQTPAPPPENEDTFKGETLYYACEQALPGPPKKSGFSVCAANVPAGPSSGSGGALLLQSFVSGCDSADAVWLKIGDDISWGVLELLDSDDSGSPENILARTALKWGGCGIGVYGPTIFPIRKTSLTKGKKYFIRYRHGAPNIPYAFTEDDAYKEGEFTGGQPGWDLDFQVLYGNGEAPYMRQARVNAECSREFGRLAASVGESPPGNSSSLDEACANIELSSSPAAPAKGSPDWVLGRLFSYKYEVKEEGFNALWPLQQEEKDKVVLAVYAYLNDTDPSVRKTAREALKRMGGYTKVLLPKFMERFRKNGSDLDLISSMGMSAVSAVPELLEMLKKTGSRELADAVANISTRDYNDVLADYYMKQMSTEAKKLEAVSIDMRDPKNLPEGCIMREFLPESVLEATGKIIWDGVSFGTYDYPLSGGEEVSLTAGQAGKMLKSVVTIEKGNYLTLSSCRVSNEVAATIRTGLGRDARNVAIRGGCQPREDYPEEVKAVVPEMEGYSGIEARGVASSQGCGKDNGCQVFSKQEFERLMGVSIPYISGETIFSIAPCRNKSDVETAIKNGIELALKDSVYRSDSEFKSFVKGLAGGWCGKAVNRAGYENTTMHLKFSESDGVMLGYAAQAWPKSSNGRHPYTPYLRLVPMRMSGTSGVTEVLFTEISEYRFNGSVWYAKKEGDGFRIKGPVSDDHVYLVTRNCQGFWTGPESDK